MSDPQHVLAPASTRRAAKPAPAVETAAPQPSDITTLQHVIGNYEVQRLLAQGHPLVAQGIQAKLHVGAANDSYEREADNVAGAVMTMSEPPVQRSEEEEMEGEQIQAKRSDIQRAEEEEMEDEQIQAKRLDIQRASVDMMGEFDVEGDVEQGIQKTSGGGQPLADSARSFFEPRFGHEFENVHVHVDSQADSLNRSIQARAFTKGSDIYFASGEYQPESSSGRSLLAHELTHVIQQTGGSPTRK
jgi:hypothetical protein